jgi:hypothetical protein
VIQLQGVGDTTFKFIVNEYRLSRKRKIAQASRGNRRGLACRRSHPAAQNQKRNFDTFFPQDTQQQTIQGRHFLYIKSTMTVKRMLQNNIKLHCRVYYQAISKTLLLSLLAIRFAAYVDAHRLGESLPHLLRAKAEATSPISTHDSHLHTVSGSDRRILVENHLSNNNNLKMDETSTLESKGNNSDIAASEAKMNPTTKDETAESKNQDTHSTSQGEKGINNPSGVSNDHGSNEPSNPLYPESSNKENTFTELEVEDINTIIREGTSPIKMFQGSRGLLFCVVLAVCFSIFTAWQVADNPDGAYSSLCRWTVSMVGHFVRVLLFPLDLCFHFNDRGHVPLATSDYGYKDPSLEFV